jgi:hypothetical protein
MGSLLTDSEKQAIQLELDSVRDTFFRDIYVFVKKTTDSPYVLPEDYNSLYGSPKQTTKHATTRDVLDKITIQAIVKYDNFQDERIVDAKSQMNLAASEGRIRLKVKKDGYEKLKIASRVEVDDSLYTIEGDAKHIGPFDSQYYQINLKREN